MKLKYTGSADAYELSAADFKRAGVENARKTRFPAGEPVEVEDNVAQALLSDEGIFTGFAAVFEQVEDDAVSDDDAGPRSSGNEGDGDTSDGEEMTDTGRKNSSGTPGTPAGGGGTGGRGGRSRGTTTSA